MRMGWIGIVLSAGAAAFAQEAQPAPQDPPKAQEDVKEVRIFASDPTRGESVFEAPYSVDVIDRNDFHRRQVRSVPEAAKESPGVHLQRTGPAQGSPVIRGMTGYSTVLLVDGIRLNHSAQRSGPNQYWGTVDAFLIDRLELIRGPSSVLYGSDSLGGTVYATTIEPEVKEPGFHVHSRTYGRFGSADSSYAARQEVSGNLDDVGWLLGGTYRDFNDVNGGRHTGLMKGTAFDEYDADGKVVVRVSEKSRLVLAAQHHRTDDAARWHSTVDSKSWHGTTTGTDRQRDFDQERNLYYLQYHWSGQDGALDAFKASLSWHRQAESETRVTSALNREIREFTLETPGVWVQAGKQTGLGYVTAGAEFYRDLVRSRGHDWAGATGVRTSFERGSIADDARYDLMGIYLQDEFSAGALDVTPGVRLSRADVEADEVDPNTSDAVVFDSFDDTFQAVTGSLRFLYHVNENWNVIAGWGMGFRAPSLDDTTAIKLVMSGALDLPATDLEPEKTHTFDLGVRARYASWEVTAFAFYTLLRDLIARVPVPDFNGDGVGDFTKDNFSDGWIYGFEISALVRVTGEVAFFGDWGYARGRADQLVGTAEDEQPVSKMAPWTAHLGARVEPKGSRVWVEGLVTVADRQSHLAPAEGTDTQRIPPKHGTPGYTVYTLRGGYVISEHVTASAAVENITDRDYRQHGSGLNEPGTHFTLGVDVRF